MSSFPRVRDDFATDFSRSYRFTYLQALINRPIHKVGCTESEEFWSPTLTFESLVASKVKLRPGSDAELFTSRT